MVASFPSFADFADVDQSFRSMPIACFGDVDHPDRSGATLVSNIIDLPLSSVNTGSFFLMDSPVI
jgi:hypothetical protein